MDSYIYKQIKLKVDKYWNIYKIEFLSEGLLDKKDLLQEAIIASWKVLRLKKYEDKEYIEKVKLAINAVNFRLNNLRQKMHQRISLKKNLTKSNCPVCNSTQYIKLKNKYRCKVCKIDYLIKNNRKFIEKLPLMDYENILTDEEYKNIYFDFLLEDIKVMLNPKEWQIFYSRAVKNLSFKQIQKKFTKYTVEGVRTIYRNIRWKLNKYFFK